MNSTELIIDQENTGYRYSIEPFLLADFITLLPDQSVLDIGTGCGIIPILLVHRQPSLKVTAIEIQECSQAQKNIHQNGMEKQISLIQGDFLEEAESLKPECFDHIVSNPPYRKIQTGRINPDSGKAVARHELSLNMGSLLDKSAPLLKKGGQISLAYPPERLGELMRELECRSLYPNRACFVHGNYQAPAKIVLVSALKGKKADFSVAPPLAVYNEDGTYSQEMAKVYASFNYIDRPNRIGKE
ncbi:MAG: tRNA (adenine(22)-N(1))-methyltransferase TrmK [Nitrospinae bacterium]|nr:tRNA (adenine(22)-N(1))-methyltransferase TrmK [Nitrospinota bacterium]MBL7020919.1 tRNA (adenine(22)-N(1))-methyltransferase TrmK [Nitrospinaceae bacterium]